MISEREIIRPHVSVSRPIRLGGSFHSHRTTTHEHLIEDAVLPSEIEQLPDLTGFLKFASQAEWRRIVLSDAKER